MEPIFRRAVLACWTAILLLVLAVALYPPPAAPHVTPRLQVVDTGADLALQQAAAIKVVPPPPPPVPQPPGRLIIKSIGINAAVVPVTVDRDGAMATPTTSHEVGWYSPGVVPGETGDAVIDGHLDWYDTSRAVFYNLKQMKVGDDVEVQRLDGITKHFRVTSVRSVPWNSTVPGMFEGTGAPRLTLITCGGTWNQAMRTYLERTIVDAAMVN
jgi:LPXTG-site transpeptidase (sortase) family protein